MASQVNLTVLHANDTTVDLAVTEQDGITPQNLAGLTPSMLVKASAAAADSSGTTLTLSTGLAVVSAPGGTLTAFLPAAMLASPGTTWWRLDVQDGGGHVTTCMYGNFVIAPV